MILKSLLIELIKLSETFGSSIKSQVLDLKTLPIFSPLEISVTYHTLVRHQDIREKSLSYFMFDFPKTKRKFSLNYLQGRQ